MSLILCVSVVMPPMSLMTSLYGRILEVQEEAGLVLPESMGKATISTEPLFNCSSLLNPDPRPARRQHIQELKVWLYSPVSAIINCPKRLPLESSEILKFRITHCPLPTPHLHTAPSNRIPCF